LRDRNHQSSDRAYPADRPPQISSTCFDVLAHLRVMPDANESRDYEWVVEQVSPRGMHVGCTDTVVGLFAGLLGSFVAGLLVLWWAGRHEARGGWSQRDRAVNSARD
jgi:hypothetical protein